MLQFRNDTGLEGTIFLSPDPDGVDTVYAVVKGTFALGGLAEWGEALPAAEQLPVAMAPVHHGEPDASSIRVPSDVGLEKPGTDVLLVGHAYAPGAWPVEQADVALAAGPVRRHVRVLGDRVWSGAAGETIPRPAPFERLPLVWERAFGGTDVVDGTPQGELRNPVGTGFRAPDGDRPPDGVRLPNLEDPAHPILSPKDRPPPACFAPVAAHWEPRRSFAGTYDDAWQRERAPYLPTDFDPRFFQLAPPELVVPGFLQGGDPVEVLGARPGGHPLRFRLPAVRVTVAYALDAGTEARTANLDTVLVEPDEMRVVVTWRAALPCDKRALRVREVRATVARLPGWR
jgi:hypothetical protein